MKSATLCEAIAPPVVNSPAPPALPPSENSGPPFGALLEVATQASPDTDESDAAAMPTEDAKEAKQKKQDDALTITPLSYFCPPPTIDPPPVTATGTNETAEVKLVLPETTPSTTTCVAPEAPAATASAIDLVQPKSAEKKKESASQGTIKLDPKVFKSVSDQNQPIDPTKSIATETAELQRPPLPVAAHGTVVAQLENRVKNSEKSAEIAPTIEQKLPVRDLLRRAVVEISRVESFNAQKQSNLLAADFQATPAETIPVKSLEAVRVVETIRTEVTNMRIRGDATMTVVLRPDSSTQLAVDVSISRDGTVHAQARFERGDFQALHSQWPQLQQSLAAHGIRVADLSNQNNSQQQSNQRSGESFQNFERGQNPAQREDRNGPSFEEQFTATRGKISPVVPQPQPAPAAPATTRRWQSWA
jgi:hypothetical protein